MLKGKLMPIRRFNQMSDHFTIAAPPPPQPAETTQSSGLFSCFKRKLPKGVVETDIPSRIARNHPGKFAYSKDVRKISANRPDEPNYVGYVFRVDNRSPDQIRELGGFWPYHTTLDTEAFNAPRPFGQNRTADFTKYLHSGHGNYKTPYVSASLEGGDAIRVYSPTGQGYLYAMLTEGGVFLNSRPLLKEIILPGGAEWADVVAYRQLNTNQVNVRREFPEFDPNAWPAIYDVLRR